MRFTSEELFAAATLVQQVVSPTQQYPWPLLAQHVGCEVWVKHENHTPTGAFKVRGGVIYLSTLKNREPSCEGVIAATTGNHGQSVAVAAKAVDLRSIVVVPEGNNPEKNRAMLAQGAELIVRGTDFQESLEYAELLAQERGLHMIPSFHPDLVKGVASYALELFENAGELDSIYVPVGLGGSDFTDEWIKDNRGINITEKNKWYSELTFHYYLWKNEIKSIDENTWTGFCAYRDFWVNEFEYYQYLYLHYNTHIKQQHQLIHFLFHFYI